MIAKMTKLLTLKKVLIQIERQIQRQIGEYSATSQIDLFCPYFLLNL